ncbi:MAG: 50S ribosomal protein L29 [Candidatus Edwardsbacteria bacterium]
MKPQNIRQLTRKEVEQKLHEGMQSLFNLRLRRGTQELTNPINLRLTRREIARLKTILREDELGIKRLASGMTETKHS